MGVFFFFIPGAHFDTPPPPQELIIAREAGGKLMIKSGTELPEGHSPLSLLFGDRISIRKDESRGQFF